MALSMKLGWKVNKNGVALLSQGHPEPGQKARGLAGDLLESKLVTGLVVGDLLSGVLDGTAPGFLDSL